MCDRYSKIWLVSFRKNKRHTWRFWDEVYRTKEFAEEAIKEQRTFYNTDEMRIHEYQEIKRSEDD
jgi:hypothetical protein